VQETLDRHKIERLTANASDPNRPLRVLCVDDHTDAADALAAVAECLGCQTRVCYDGPMALQTIEEFCPDVCLLDLKMPGMDGFELAARIQSEAGHQPLLLVAATALGSLEDRTKTALAGFHFHLVKPITITALQDTLDRFREMMRRGEPGEGPGSPETV